MSFNLRYSLGFGSDFYLSVHPPRGSYFKEYPLFTLVSQTLVCGLLSLVKFTCCGMLALSCACTWNVFC